MLRKRALVGGGAGGKEETSAWALGLETSNEIVCIGGIAVSVITDSQG